MHDLIMFNIKFIFKPLKQILTKKIELYSVAMETLFKRTHTHPTPDINSSSYNLYIDFIKGEIWSEEYNSMK